MKTKIKILTLKWKKTKTLITSLQTRYRLQKKMMILRVRASSTQKMMRLPILGSFRMNTSTRKSTTCSRLKGKSSEATFTHVLKPWEVGRQRNVRTNFKICSGLAS